MSDIEPILYGPPDVKRALRLRTLAQAQDLWEHDSSFPGITDAALGMVVDPLELRTWVRERIQAARRQREIDATKTAYNAATEQPTTTDERRRDDREEALGNETRRDQSEKELLWRKPRRNPKQVASGVQPGPSDVPPGGFLRLVDGDQMGSA